MLPAALCGILCAQAPSGTPPAASGKIRLLIQADDMGALHGINAATITAYKEGIVRATNVIVPGPWLLEAARLLNESPGLDVGVHLTLTSEWDFIKWRPLTPMRSMVDENGYFFPFLHPDRIKPDLGEVERELRAQIETLKRLVPHTNYVSAHMGFDGQYPEIGAIVRKLAREYNLYYGGREQGIASLGRVFVNAPRGAATETGAAQAARLAARLERIGPGTYRFIEHASTNDPEMQSITSGQDVAGQREAVMRAWCSPLVKEVIRKRNIRLIGYRDLLPEQ